MTQKPTQPLSLKSRSFDAQFWIGTQEKKMGCSQSKIENEEAVSRCKDRKLHMKDAVTARNAFAAAHTGYAMSLKNTGAALSDYAHGEVLPSQHGVPSVAPATFDNLPPPPPPLPNFSNLQRATSLPERLISKSSHPGVGPVIEEEDEDEIDDEESVGRLRRRRNSRGGAGAGASAGNRDLEEEVEGPPPPVPPSPSRTPPPSQNRYIPTPIPQNSTFDFFFSVENMPSSSLSEPDEITVNKNDIERKVFDEKPKKIDGGDTEGRKGKAEDAPPLPEKIVEAAKNAKKVKQVGVAVPPEGKRIVKSNVNLLQIFVDIDDHFLKASESAQEVSKMLEATRLHYHSNFADNRGHIDHSARVMRVITWNRSFRKMPNTDDGKDDFDAEEHETHASVLDKLLAWEKKLYDEVKAGEVMKIEYQRKVNTLNKLKRRGSNTEALEKAKAAVSHLHTRYMVDLQSMDSTVSEINRLRDQQLYPKLVQLIDGMAVMWETMQLHHADQLKIAYALRSLDLSQSPKETSEHHHERTFQLWAVVREWHSQFEKLVGYQKNYIKSLSNWLKLNLVPVESNLKGQFSSPPRVQIPPIQGLLQAWQDHLEKLPDGLLKTAIFAFDALINTIRQYQEEELKLKSKCEETRKELSRKTRLFKEWYDKYMQRKIPEEVDNENAPRDVVAEKQFAVEKVRKRLEEEEEARLRQSLQVREKSLLSLKSHLPELFRALSEFSSASSKMYRSLSSLSQQQSSITSPA